MHKGKKGGRRSVRRFMRRHGTRSHNVPLLPVIGVAAGVAMPALRGWNMAKGQSATQRITTAIDQLGQSVYGYSSMNQKWYPAQLPLFWAPVAGTAIAHKAANWLGVNKVLSRAKLGFTL